jgi:2-polyprenyl-3-methyl-5-hydroxy-6-metoxy-1,4-benzoquinol methylase
MPDKAEQSRLYAQGAYRSESGKRFNPIVELILRLTRLARKRRIERFIRHGNILDVGCGRGDFLAVMKAGGWNATGTEVDEALAREITDRRGIPVLSDEPSRWCLQKASLDVITMNHVLEHLHDPKEMLDHCRDLLRTGGLLVCAVPNIASLQASAGKGAWFHLDLPYHIHHFSESGLTRLLEKHGFSIMRVRRFDIEYDPFGWTQTLLNLSGIHHNYLYSLLKNPILRKQDTATARRGDLLLTLALTPLFLPLGFVLALIDSYVFRRGGSIEVFAMKSRSGNGQRGSI